MHLMSVVTLVVWAPLSYFSLASSKLSVSYSPASGSTFCCCPRQMPDKAVLKSHFEMNSLNQQQAWESFEWESLSEVAVV